MKIYFSCSITGGRDDQAIYQRMVDLLVAQGHEVPTAHLSKAEVMDDERVINALDVYERDTNWVHQSDALIAEVSTPSHGVGYEIALALLEEKPVLCCYQKGKTVSKMILGNTDPNISLYAYSNMQDLEEAIGRFLQGLLFNQ
jgi:nucleoside 2-deoxyribosyltransferase